MREEELAGAVPEAPPLRQRLAQGRQLLDAVVVRIRDVDVPLSIDGDRAGDAEPGGGERAPRRGRLRRGGRGTGRGGETRGGRRRRCGRRHPTVLLASPPAEDPGRG